MRTNPKSGGCFIAIALLVGFVVGISLGNPLKGVLIGLGIGSALALILWLADRSRRGKER